MCSNAERSGLDQEVSGHRVAFLVGVSSIDSYNQMVGTERSLQASIEVHRSGDTPTRTFRDKKGNIDVEWLSAVLNASSCRCYRLFRSIDLFSHEPSGQYHQMPWSSYRAHQRGVQGGIVCMTSQPHL